MFRANSTFPLVTSPDDVPVNAPVRVGMRSTLRTATRAEHAAIDLAMAKFDLTRRDDYGAFLAIHRAALRHLQADFRDQDRADFQGMLRCLNQDLGDGEGGDVQVMPTLRRYVMSRGNRLGAAYVIRGSRLGSALLRRRVPPQFPTAYFDFVPAVSWAQFLGELEPGTGDAHPSPSDEVIAGAHQAFKIFADLSAPAGPT